MASLDDFFAKKDKSKKKKKSKFTTDELMAKKDDTGEKKEKKKEKTEKSQEPEVKVPSTFQELGGEVQADEDWKDFEQEDEKDYSGLRIQNLQISKEEKEEDENGEEDELDEDGEIIKKDPKEEDENGEEDELDEDGEIIKKDPKEDGPWQSSGSVAPQPNQQEPVAQPPPEPKQEEKPASTPGKYVPPSLRNRDTTQTTAPSTQSARLAALRRKKAAPNVNSELDFPSLGGKSEQLKQYEQEVRSGKQFEEVKGGGTQRLAETNRGPNLELGNQFDALGEN